MKKLQFGLLRLLLPVKLQLADVSAVRGFISTYFHNELLANRENSKIRYGASLVQYKIMDGDVVIVGMEQGAQILTLIHRHLTYLNLKGRELEISAKNYIQGEQEIGLSLEDMQYQFISPWMPLNQENFRAYKQFEYDHDYESQQNLLKRILIGNIIMLSKNFHYEVDIRLQIQYLCLTQQLQSFKGVQVLAFLGTFSVNFCLPQYWGIGRVPSRGFGTIIQHQPIARK